AVSSSKIPTATTSLPGNRNSPGAALAEVQAARVSLSEESIVRRPVAALRGSGENLDAGFGYTDTVLELRGGRAVARYRRPAVVQNLHAVAAEIDHRLDGEEHAGLETERVTGTAVMHDVG